LTSTQLVRALVRSGTRQGVAGLARDLRAEEREERRGKQRTVAELEAQCEALEQKATETRELLETDQGVATWLAGLGEARVERGCVSLGWAEP
jgi:hypothetical protein